VIKMSRLSGIVRHFSCNRALLRGNPKAPILMFVGEAQNDSPNMEVDSS
jgi:hypothetical protein